MRQNHEIWAYGNLDQKRQLQNLVFPSGIGYNKQNDRVQTKRVNSIFSAIPLLTTEIDARGCSKEKAPTPCWVELLFLCDPVKIQT